MEFEIQGLEGAKYLLKKDDPGWSLWKEVGGHVIKKGAKKGEIAKLHYVPMGLYPHTIEHALQLIVENHTGALKRRVDFRTGMQYLKEYTLSLTTKATEIEALAAKM